MVTTCEAVGCCNRKQKGDGRSYHRFPTDPDRLSAWVAAIDRGAGWKPKKTHRVCSDHFISGKSEDPCSPDYVPSIFKHLASPEKRKRKEKLANFERRDSLKKKRRKEEKRSHAAQALLSLADLPVVDDVEDPPQHIPVNEAVIDNDKMTQTDMSMEDIGALMSECQSLRNENIKFQEQCDNTSLSEESLKKTDRKVKILTGLPNFECLLSILTLLGPTLRGIDTLSTFQQLMVTLLRLRFNMNIQYLGYTYGVSTSTISRVFHNVINALFVKLVPTTIFWPEREVLRSTMPTCFRRTFPKCACIIDCFEIFIEKPTDFTARAQTYSNYKSHNTAKYLIGISPQGTITFISKGFGGRASDRYITEQSGFLYKLTPGDTILADRGFDIKDTLGLHGARLEIPAFTKGKKQLSASDIEKTRNIASVRIHVERVIGVTRQKYTMLESIIPITLLQKDENFGMTTFDKIVHVCCALVNVCPSVIPFD